MQAPNLKSPLRLLCHKYLAVIALAWLALFVLTGVLLNHSKSLALDDYVITHDWLLDIYGMTPEGDATSFIVNKSRVTQWDDKIFYDDHLLTETTDQIIGAASSGKRIMVIALTQSLLILDENGELVEQTSPVFMPIKQAGTLNNHIIVKTVDEKLYRADKNIMSWQPYSETDPVWSASSELPGEWQQKIKRQFRGNNLTLERVLTDLHNGRIAGTGLGPYIMDAGAILLLLFGACFSWTIFTKRQ